MSTLALAIDRLYDEFGVAAKPTTIGGCEHCFTQIDVADLLADQPLRSLPASLIDVYAFNVVSLTVDGPAEVAYFLPRIMEMVVTDHDRVVDLYLVAQVLSLEGLGWNAIQQQAIRAFLLRVWALILEGAVAADLADPVLASLAVLDGLDPALELWSARLGEASAVDVLRTLVTEQWLIRHGRWEQWNSDWLTGEGVVSDWLTNPDLRDRVDPQRAWYPTA